MGDILVVYTEYYILCLVTIYLLTSLYIHTMYIHYLFVYKTCSMCNTIVNPDVYISRKYIHTLPKCITHPLMPPLNPNIKIRFNRDRFEICL